MQGELFMVKKAVNHHNHTNYKNIKKYPVSRPIEEVRDRDQVITRPRPRPPDKDRDRDPENWSRDLHHWRRCFATKKVSPKRDTCAEKI